MTGTPAQAGPAERGRRGAGAAHLGHHLAAEDRAAAPGQRHRLGLQHRRARWRSTPDDVCLNIMPLFHIHGLIAATLSSLAAGGGGVSARRASTRSASSPGSMRCGRPGTRPCRPCTRRSWRRAERNAEIIARGRLRFIRSSSSSLPPQVMAGARDDLRRAGDRGLRHDRGRAPDGLQPAAAAARAIAGCGRHRRRAGDRHHGRGRQLLPPGATRRGGDPRPQRHRRATRTTRKPTPRPSPMAGSAPATRACSTRTAICA